MGKKKTIQITGALTSHIVTQSSVSTSIAFSPNGACQRVILEEIDKAKSTIEVLAYTINNVLILDALLQKASKGLFVTIIIDERANRNSKINFEYLIKAGIGVYKCNYFNAMHVKSIVIDSEHVITGSYNFTENAQYSNLENIILFRNNSGLAYWYSKLFAYCLSVSNLYN